MQRTTRTRIIRRTNLVSRMLPVTAVNVEKLGQDHANIFKKIGSGIKKAVNAIDEAAHEVTKVIRPKLAAKIEEAKADGDYTLKERIQVGLQGAAPLVATAATLGGAGLVVNAINKAQDKKDLALEQESAIKQSEVSPSPVVSAIGGGEPVKADIITTAVTSTPTNSTLAEKVVKAAEKVPVSIRKEIIKKGGEITSEKLGGWLTDASMLPKTKKLKDAEKMVDAAGSQSVAMASTPMSLGNNNIMYIAIGLGIVVVLIMAFKN